MTLVFNPQIQNAPLNDVRDAIDSGGASGTLDILDGATVLASLPLSFPSFADESSGQSVANPITTVPATVAGTPDSFAFKTSYGATVFTGTIPDDLDLGAVATRVGAPVSVDAFTLTEGVTQAREYVSTVEYPYNTPPLVFDSTPAPSDLVAPKALKLDPLRGQDYQSDGTTLRTATYDGSDILLDGVPLVTVADVKALDLTFDAADNALVLYTDSADALYFYDDNDQSTAALGVTGLEPRIHNDRKTDGDDAFADVVLLLHCEGANGAGFASFVDSSSYANAALGGGATITTSLSKFGTGGAQAEDGSLGLIWGNDAKYKIGTQDFTIEGWVYSQSPVNDGASLHTMTGSALEINLGGPNEQYPGKVQVVVFAAPDLVSLSDLPTEEWVHIALSRSGGFLRLFINGQLEGSVVNSTNFVNMTGFRTFQSSTQPSGEKTVYFDEYRLTIGTARYTEAFTPPSAPFADAETTTPTIVASYRRGNDVFYRLGT